MPLEGITESEHGGFWFHSIPLRNMLLLLVTDHPDGVPALGNIAIGTPTALTNMAVVSSALPSLDFKHDVIAKSIAETISRKLGKPVMLFMDVHFEATDGIASKALRVAVNDYCDGVRDAGKTIKS